MNTGEHKVVVVSQVSNICRTPSVCVCVCVFTSTHKACSKSMVQTQTAAATLHV